MPYCSLGQALYTCQSSQLHIHALDISGCQQECHLQNKRPKFRCLPKNLGSEFLPQAIRQTKLDSVADEHTGQCQKWGMKHISHRPGWQGTGLQETCPCLQPEARARSNIFRHLHWTGKQICSECSDRSVVTLPKDT